VATKATIALPEPGVNSGGNTPVNTGARGALSEKEKPTKALKKASVGSGVSHKATPQELSQSPETREIEQSGGDVVQSDIERAIRILEAAGLGHVAALLSDAVDFE
jgi:hypothetical protein